MAKLDADMQSLVRRTILCFAATTNSDGSPNGLEHIDRA